MKKFAFLFLLLPFVAFAQDDEIVLDNDEPQEDEFSGVMPVQTEFSQARYPSEIMAAGIQGDVVLDLLVSETGSVDSVAVSVSLNPTLDSAAVEAARNFKFIPAMMTVKKEVGKNKIEETDTIPVAVIIQYVYRFSLKNAISDGIENRVNFRGRVFERGTRKPLSDVLVAIVYDTNSIKNIPVPFSVYMEKISEFGAQNFENATIFTFTDSAANFSFHSLPAGKFTVKIPHSGYEAYFTSDSIAHGDSLVSDMYLTAHTYNDYEVVAYYKGEEKEVSRHQLTLSEARKIPGLSGDAVKVVQALPGVARPTAATGAIIVRGTSTNDSKFLLDGTDILLLYHFGGLKSTYNSEALETIEFYPGGWGVKYGDATGGVVELKSRPPKTDRFHGYLDASVLDMSFLVETPIGEKWSVLATARRSYFGEIVKLAVNAIGNGVTVIPFYWDYVVRADLKANEKNRFSFTSFSSNDSLAVVIEGMGAGSEEIGNATNSLTQRMFFNINGMNWESKINERFENFFSLKSEVIRQSMGAMGYVRTEMKANGFRYYDNLGIKLGEKTKMNLGIDGYLGVVNMNADMVSDRGLVHFSKDDFVFARLGAYTNFEIKPVERWLVVPGIRYDYYDELKYKGSVLPEFWDYGEKFHKGFSGEPAFRLSTRFNLTKEHLIKGAIGTYNQSPKPIGMVIDSIYGNPALGTTKAAHFVLGYEWQITDLISFDIQGYRNNQWKIPRMAGSRDLEKTKNPADIKMYYDDEKGKSRGIEIMLRHNQNEKFFGWIAYTLSQSKRKTPHTDTMSADGWVRYSYDQTNNLQLLASYKLPKRWELGGRLRYTTGNPTTPIKYIEYDLTDNEIDGYYGKYNSDRFEPFFQFDFRAEKKWIFKKSTLTAYWDIQNMLYFLYKSPEFRIFDDFYKEKQFIAMPIIPSFGIRYDF